MDGEFSLDEIGTVVGMHDPVFDFPLAGDLFECAFIPS